MVVWLRERRLQDRVEQYHAVFGLTLLRRIDNRGWFDEAGRVDLDYGVVHVRGLDVHVKRAIREARVGAVQCAIVRQSLRQRFRQREPASSVAIFVIRRRDVERVGARKDANVAVAHLGRIDAKDFGLEGAAGLASLADGKHVPSRDAKVER